MAFGTRQRPALKGSALALLAAMLFGASTPLLQHLGHGVGPLLTAGLLYLGAAVAGFLLRQPIAREARLRRSDLPRLLAVVGFGAVVGPVALAWGLQRSGGTAASLMLTLEAVFTALLARQLYGETMDRRVWVAVLLLLAGGAWLVLDQRGTGGSGMPGLLAVLAATAAWGMDNALSRGLVERDPGQVVLAKATLGAAATLLLSRIASEPLPDGPAVLGLMAVGATGYGLSLRFYLLAQRAFGAARTGSVFASAPFIGAVLAVALGNRPEGMGIWIAGPLMMAGVVLHLTERHEHAHEHGAMDHEHAHHHHDGHHDHEHAVMPTGPHSHPHHHGWTAHHHAHVPDAHHGHHH